MSSGDVVVDDALPLLFRLLLRIEDSVPCVVPVVLGKDVTVPAVVEAAMVRTELRGEVERRDDDLLGRTPSRVDALE